MKEQAQPLGLRAGSFDKLTAGDVMAHHVQYGQGETKASVLASMMIEGCFGGVPIVDADMRLIGIVTEFDLFGVLGSGKKLSLNHSGKELSDLTAADIMTPEPMNVAPHTDIQTVMYLLHSNHLIRLPVIDHMGKLVGVVARRDVLRGYLHFSAVPRL